VRGRCQDGDYARFLEATLRLIDASAGLTRRARVEMEVAILRVCESDRVARAALLGGEPQRLALAAGNIRRAREELIDASVDAAAEGRRKRTILLVA